MRSSGTATARWPRRVADRWAERFRQRGRTAALRALRLTGAATAAYLVALWLLSAPQPLLAPLTALLVVQVTLFGTLADSARRVVSVLAGVALAVLVASLVGFSWVSLAGLIAASLVVGQMLRLGPHLLEVPISGMLVLGTGGSGAAAKDRIVETLVGAGVGIAVNVLVPPSDQSRPAGVVLQRYVEEIAELLDRLAAELPPGPAADDATHWVEDTRELTRDAVRVEHALEHAAESRRLNPRVIGTTDPGLYLRSGLEALEHVAVAVRGMCRIIAEGIAGQPDGPDLGDPRVRDAVAALLSRTAGAVRAFGAVVRAEAGTHPGEDVQDEELTEALGALRDARLEVSAILDEDHTNPRQWQLHDAVLAGVERVLRELDAQDRARLRERRHDEAVHQWVRGRRRPH